MNIRWRKVIGDLSASRRQMALVGLAIGIGAMAVAAASTAGTLIGREIDASFLSARPAGAVLVVDRIDETTVREARVRPGVSDATARRLVRGRVSTPGGRWLPLQVYVIPDFADQRVSTVHRHSGDWPPKDGEMLIEQSCLDLFQVNIGDTLKVRLPTGGLSEVRVGGIAHDPRVAPGWQDQIAYTYVTPRTLAALGEGADLDELHITTTVSDRAAVAATATDLAAWLEGRGRTIRRVEVPQAKHPHADDMATMALLLQLFGGLALVLSGVLTANVIAAVLARHVRQIGVLKAVGATTGQVATMYLAMIGTIAAIAVVVCVPAGVAVGREFFDFAADKLNLEVTDRAMAAWLLAAQAAVAFFVPLVIAAIPILRAVRMTPREAIQQAEVVPPVARGGRRRLNLFADRRLLLGFRNSFRRPVRLALTLGSLSLGGALLLTGTNVYLSLLKVTDRTLAERSDDIEVRLLEAAPRSAVTEVARGVPGVDEVEAWGMVLAAIELGDSSSASAIGTARYNVFAPPPDTAMRQFHLREGRWPGPDERDAVVVNRNVQDQEAGLALGSSFVLRVDARRTSVRVVGVVQEVGPPAIYTTAAALEDITGGRDRAMNLRLSVTGRTPEAVAADLEQALVREKFFPTYVLTRGALRERITDHFLIILAVLSGAALAAVIVGGLSLGASASLNVLERTREIGVLRAVGATPRAVFLVLLAEGAAVAGLSAVLAAALSLPVSFAVAALIGRHSLHTTLPLVISPLAVAGWFVATGVITFVAVAWPASRASRLSVCEAIAYE